MIHNMVSISIKYNMIKGSSQDIAALSYWITWIDRLGHLKQYYLTSALNGHNAPYKNCEQDIIVLSAYLRTVYQV